MNLYIKSLPYSLLCAFLMLFPDPILAQPETVPNEHPVTTGSQMRFPMEQTSSAPSHAEGILGRYFPNLHGTEALHFDYVYNGGVFNNARGGAQTRNGTVYNGCFEIGITADTEKLGLWRNGTFFMHSFFSHGPSPSRFVGDYQGVSVFGYETPAQVGEYWYMHELFDGVLTIKGGKQDAGADFFFLESTADFINSSTTLVPTAGMPSIPDNAWGIAGFLDLTDHFCLKAGVYDARPNGNKFWMSESGDVYSIYQAEYHYRLFRHLPGFVYLGGWYDSSKTESLTQPGRWRTGRFGFSMGFEQMIYRHNICDKEDMRGLIFFVQYSEGGRNRHAELKGFWALGFQWLGLFEPRPDDIAGFAVNTVRFSDGFRASEDLTYGQERAYEIYYKIQLTENVTLQPVFQYVVHPSGTYRNSFVPGLVFQTVF